MSTFAEETVDPRRTVPRAIVVIVAIGGSIFTVVAYVVQLVHAGGIFDNPDSAALDIARAIGGDLFAAVFLATVIVAQFTAGTTSRRPAHDIQAAGALLMYAMGRDGSLPRGVFGYVSPRSTQQPRRQCPHRRRYLAASRTRLADLPHPRVSLATT
ncbi:MAG: hypothetical protein WA991_04210 [Ornithinimicrobium sp.]